MEEVFIIAGVIGFALLLLSFFVGDILDLDFLDGAFGMKSIAAFAAAFGVVGYGLTQTSIVSVLVAAIFAVAAGLFGSLIVVSLTRFLINSESGQFAAEDLIGKKGTLVNPVGPDLRGQVEVAHDGMKHIYSAVSDTEMGTGTTVKLTEKVGLSTFTVVNASNPYDPINQTA